MLESLMLPGLAAALIFLIVIFATSALEKNKGVQERVRRIATPSDDMPSDPMMDSIYNEERPSAMANFMEMMLKLTGTNVEKFRKESQMKFYRAGITSPNAVVYYLFFKRIGFIFFLLLAYFFISIPETGAMKMAHYLIALLMIIIGLFGPNLYLSNNEQKRKKTLQRSFPDALDLLLVCVESGLALDGALNRVCRELGKAYPEITEELNRTRLELTLLNDRAQALNNLAERTDMISFRALTSTLLQSEKFGTSLTDTLRVLSEDYRNTRLMLAEEKAGRLPVLMTVPLITMMMPALFLIILGPTIIRALAVSSGSGG